MNYAELNELIASDNQISKNIYVCNFLSCKETKIKSTPISLVKNLFGKYVVTKWLDYEYGKYSSQTFFKDKNLAASYAWKLYCDL